ncbi:aspartate--tRNA(Asn) ligase [Candidatus Bathyarchaeota archaeon]|nr:aspartate--tRNA(Asn) ligase [Candidatus Bathyarchaeota archaeon]
MFDRTYISDLESKLEEKVNLAGWVTRTRDLKNIRFIVLRDMTGEIQIVVKPESPQMFELNLNREDVIKVTGEAVQSKIANAGLEFIPDAIEVINRSEQPLPVDILENKKSELDTRLNWRFLDFRAPTTNAIFRVQNALVTGFRSWLTEHDYMEFQPPCIIGSASEGGADLFAIPYFERQAYLAQSPQLYKQMCAMSFEKVFTITPIWRAEKFNTPTHLNEVRQMDIEQAFANDEDVMSVLEKVLVNMLKEAKEKTPEELEMLDRDIEIPELPLKRVTYTEAIQMLQNEGETILWGDDFTKTQEKLLTELVGQEAFFMKDWPGEQKAFYAMPYNVEVEEDVKYLEGTYPDNPDIGRRIVRAFDCLYSGIEISSGTMRIHLPELLKERLKFKGLNPDNFEYYIGAFRYGAPPHAGWSIGMERITMTVTGMENIREACMFPRDRDRLVP